MQVNIHGLYIGDEQYLLRNIEGENWVINDWYQFNGWIRPTRIYNLHRYPFVHSDENRFIGDWRGVYNKAGVPVITVEEIDGITNQQILPIDELKSMVEKDSDLSCSISTMIYHAVFDGYDEINLYAVKLTGDEYAYQIKGILRAIKFAENKGIKFNIHPDGRMEEWQSRQTTVDWAFMKDIDHCYWDRSLGTLSCDITVTCDKMTSTNVA